LSLHDLIEAVVDLVRGNAAWAAPVAFVLAFLESLALFSLLVPAWAALVAIGALVQAAELPFWPVWIAASLGAAMGDWVSYWLGYTFKERVADLWPLSRHPKLLTRGHAFMEKWGVGSVFIGRFFGPLRAAIPLCAGILKMRFLPFQLANFTSAAVWAWLLLAVGDFGAEFVGWLA
jgi:membrane protein DedA with SNARE-associated domain